MMSKSVKSLALALGNSNKEEATNAFRQAFSYAEREGVRLSSLHVIREETAPIRADRERELVDKYNALLVEARRIRERATSLQDEKIVLNESYQNALSELSQCQIELSEAQKEIARLQTIVLALSADTTTPAATSTQSDSASMIRDRLNAKKAKVVDLSKHPMTLKTREIFDALLTELQDSARGYFDYREPKENTPYGEIHYYWSPGDTYHIWCKYTGEGFKISTATFGPRGGEKGTDQYFVKDADALLDWLMNRWEVML